MESLVLRKFIREAMRSIEESSGLAFFYSDDMFVLYDPKGLRRELMFAQARPVMKPENACKFAFTSQAIAALSTEDVGENARRISRVWSSERGYGSFLYDSVMKLTGDSIVPDVKTSASAQKIWDKYRERPDVVFQEDPVKVTPGPNFRTDFNLGPLLKAHELCVTSLLESDKTNQVLSAAGLKDKSNIERFFKTQCFKLLEDAVGTGY